MVIHFALLSLLPVNFIFSFLGRDEPDEPELIVDVWVGVLQSSVGPDRTPGAKNG